MIPEDKVREVAERLSIVEVVSEYVPLRRAGANFTGLCPFHAEKTPSFNVNPAREIFHCFGCGAGGNAFSFIMRIEGLSFPEAVKLMARKTGVEIEERQLTPVEKQAQSERQTFQRINDLAAGFYRSVLEQRPEGAMARAYLEKRAAIGEIAEAYRLGFASDRGDGLVQHLKSNGMALESALKLGLVRKSERGWYDQFRNRLMFPIRDAKGAVIAFAGRVLDASLPKYINSPESPLYHKSSVLFGLDMALPSIRTENSVIIVEGYFDHLALFRAGIRNVVATCGTALTTTHTGLIKRHAARVYTLFDSDAAGRKATIRSMELFMEQRLPAYVITLPAGDDPDSFLANNPVEVFRTCQEKARPAFEFFIRSLLAQTPPDSVDSKVRIIDELLPRFKKIADPVERDLYEKEICRLLGITVHAFRKRMGGMNLTDRDTRIEQKQALQKGDPVQETLLALICGYPEARDEALRTGSENLFDGDYLELARLVLDTLANNDDTQALSRLSDRIEAPGVRSLLSRMLVSDARMADIDWRSAFDSCLRSREKLAIQPIRDMATQLAVLDPDSPEYTALLKKADALRTRKSKIQP
ncbi:MAG: DNA primase [Desulfuromonadales bacterium]|nr:DNA primase [Desulfuromonadales bacterium]